MKHKTMKALAIAAILLAGAASAGIVRSRVIPASVCGELAPQAGGRLVLPSFDGGKVSVTLGRRMASVTGHASFGGIQAMQQSQTIFDCPSQSPGSERNNCRSLILRFEAGNKVLRTDKIGRASCRERV